MQRAEHRVKTLSSLPMAIVIKERQICSPTFALNMKSKFLGFSPISSFCMKVLRLQNQFGPSHNSRKKILEISCTNNVLLPFRRSFHDLGSQDMGVIAL